MRGRKGLIPILLALVLVLAACSTVGVNLEQDLLAVGVVSNESAKQAYRTVRIAWHEGLVSQEDMLRADELYTDFVVLIKAYKFMLRSSFAEQTLTYAEMNQMEEKLVKKLGELESLAASVTASKEEVE